MHEWILYMRPGCHLCEEAEEWLLELAEQRGTRLMLVNILADPDIYELYKWKIPVLRAGGMVWEAPLDPASLAAALPGQ
jgi:hypothetical protein